MPNFFLFQVIIAHDPKMSSVKSLKHKHQDEMKKRIANNMRRLIEKENVPNSPSTKSVTFNPATVETSFGGSQTPGRTKLYSDDSVVHLDFTHVDAQLKKEEEAAAASASVSASTSASPKTSSKPATSAWRTKTPTKQSSADGKDTKVKEQNKSGESTKTEKGAKPKPLLSSAKRPLSAGVKEQKSDVKDTNKRPHSTGVKDVRTPAKDTKHRGKINGHDEAKDMKTKGNNFEPHSNGMKDIKTPVKDTKHKDEAKDTKVKIHVDINLKTDKTPGTPHMKTKLKTSSPLPNQFKQPQRVVTTESGDSMTTPARKSLPDHLKSNGVRGTPDCFNPVSFDTPLIKSRQSSGDVWNSSLSRDSIESDSSSMTVAVRVRPFSAR